MNYKKSFGATVLFLVAIALSVGCSSDTSAQTAEKPAATPAKKPAGATARNPGEDQNNGDQQAAPQKKQHTNRLAQETSPYLLLHAHNPVDWYPWGAEALAKAKQEKKVIFLSIGYSSCHWCHVMERESFMDEEIAAFMNAHFVCIKVDREERPDVDSIYMTSLQVYNQLSGSGRGGGWPLSMFMLPDGRPFFGGTYFPARDGDRGAATGFLTLLKRVHEIWSASPDKIEADSEIITKHVKEQLESRRPGSLKPIDEKVLDATLAALEEQYDEDYGGFGFDPANSSRPKFPEPSNLFFLIDRVQKKQDETALKLLTGTLQRMAMGGIRDHLGGGFHRYSVDRFWHIPHFEKMLYDNGQLASVYSEAYVLTGREDFRRVVDEMLTFVLREMTDENGGFYSALDAESENEEGKYYRWDKKEVQDLIGADDVKLFASVYGLDGEPNFEEHYYAPQLSQPLARLAADRETTEAKLEARLRPIRDQLFAARGKRPRPLTDTKILAGWNGLMIRGFADAGRALKNEEYVTAAGRAADFVLGHLRDKDGRLLRTYGKGKAKLNAYVDDYAYLIDGLIALYRATGERKWLTAADDLMAKQLDLFWDEAGGGFFFTSDDHESLLARGRNPIDGARPSGGSVSAANLIFLAKELDKPDYRQRAEKTIQSVSSLLETVPAAVPRMAVAVSEWLDTEPPK